MSTLTRGAGGGALATAAMSVVMLAGGRAGLMGEQPPKQIVRAMLPGHKHRPKKGERLLGTAAHFLFGSMFGALFGMLCRDRPVRLATGIAYALAIWLASYQGWVPSLNILPPITRDPRPGRQVVMAAGHIVYGTALVVAMNRLRARPSERFSEAL
jgi:uncharacterized membrane protein YagU involved in acid resistance